MAGNRNIHSEIEIKAPVQRVWQTLLDFKSYPHWNPFIVSIKGKPEAGGSLVVTMKQPGGATMTFSPRCLKCEENGEFRWQGKLFIRGLFDGEHIFRLRPAGEGRTKFMQSENFSGILLPLLWKSLNTKTLKGFEMMNRALKQRAEE